MAGSSAPSDASIDTPERGAKKELPRSESRPAGRKRFVAPFMKARQREQ
jgi:hypothetical protein